MKPRNILIAGFVGSMALLGIFVNSLFLLVAGMSLCGLMHASGHHGGKAHAHHSQTKEDDAKSISANDA